MSGVASVHVPFVMSFTRDCDCAVIISGGENMNIDEECRLLGCAAV
jgi:hypothetical protein